MFETNGETTGRLHRGYPGCLRTKHNTKTCCICVCAGVASFRHRRQPRPGSSEGLHRSFQGSSTQRLHGAVQWRSFSRPKPGVSDLDLYTCPERRQVHARYSRPTTANGRWATRTPPGRTKVLFETHSRTVMKQFPGGPRSWIRSRGGAQRTKRSNGRKKRNGRHRRRPRRRPVPRLVHSRLRMPALLHRHPVGSGRLHRRVLLSAESRLTADVGPLRPRRESACLPRVARFPRR